MLRKKKTEAQSGQEIPAGAQSSSGQAAKAKPLDKVKAFVGAHRIPVIIGVCVVAVAVFLLWPKGKSKAANASAEYIETTPQIQDITNTFSDTGTIAAADSYSVTSLVSGDVLTADFVVGDKVQKGDVLYTIDSSDVQNELEKAQISLEQAQRSYDETVDTQYIRTKTAGTLVSYSVKVGDVVKAGDTVAVVRDGSTMLLTVEFPAVDAAGFYVGQSATVIINGTFEAVNGTIRTISGADQLSDGNLLARKVTIAVDNSAGSLTTAQAAMASINGVDSVSSAKLEYSQEQTITAANAGTVEKLCATAGSKVSRDAALVQISDTDITKQINSAYDTLRNAELSLSSTQDKLDNYTITAPISGTIVQKNVKAGEKISSGTSSATTLCIIYDLDYLEMTVDVDELKILTIQEGQEASVTADAISDQTYKGVVTSVLVAGTTSGGTTTYPITIRIDDTGDLRPGMNATAEIEVESADGALTVPNAAIVRGSYVLVTEASPSAANADTSMEAPDGYVYVKVVTGVSDDDNIEIKSGLTASDTIAYSADAAAALQSSNEATEFGGMRGGPGGGGPGGGGPGGGF